VDQQPLCDGEWIAPASWLRRGTSWDGRPVTCIDVDAVVGRIGSA
jgi:hypothetical protein